MSVEVIMPKAGVAMEEGTIVSWLKQEGEEVKIGEPILEITTDSRKRGKSRGSKS